MCVEKFPLSESGYFDIIGAEFDLMSAECLRSRCAGGVPGACGLMKGGGLVGAVVRFLALRGCCFGLAVEGVGFFWVYVEAV